MTENDNQQTESLIFDGFDTDTEGDDDIHLCKKCKLLFTNLSDYLQHKVKHDNYKVKMSRTGDRRMLVPQLIQKPEKPATSSQENMDEKENVQQRRRGKKKQTSEINPDLITEKQLYWCPKCNVKFNREATLRRHVEYVHDQSGEYTTAMGEGSDNEEKTAAIGEIGTPAIDESEVTDPTYKAEGEIQETREIHIQVHIEDDRPFACTVCGNRFKEAPVLRAHMLTHSSRKDFPCTVDGCMYAFKTKGSLKRHMRRHTGERPFSCEECGRSFTESGALTRHLKSRVSCKNKTDLDLPRYGKKWGLEPNSGNNLRMSSIRIQGPQQQPVIQESQEIGKDMETECAIAEVIASTERDEETVVEEVNLDDVVPLANDDILEEEILAPTQCKVCKEDFLSCDILKIHLRAHLADIPFRCGLCHFVAESRAQLSNHMISLHQSQLKGPELVQQIPEGSCTSETKHDQNRIAKIAVKQLLDLPSSVEPEPEPSIHRARAMYRCPVCTRAFRSNNYLRLHMKSHTGDRPHKCTFCDKSFITKDTLTKHLSVHSDFRNYKCGQCGKLFKRISHVREHLKIHSVDRPFPCSVCQKSFKTNNAMKVHLRTHTSILPYVCPFCRRRFREKGSLLRHQRMHTGERPYRCQHCSRSFAEHGTLNRHLRAKVPCTRQLQEAREKERESTEMNVLTEFSSVVADTQQYIMSNTEEHSQQSQESEETTEYVVLQTGLSEEDLQNVEIITDGEVDHNFLEGVQVTDDYVVITDVGDNMKILDSRTGETLATMPLSSLSENDSQVVTLPSTDHQIEAVAMTPGSFSEIEALSHGNLNEIEAVAMAPSSSNEMEVVTMATMSAGKDSMTPSSVDEIKSVTMMNSSEVIEAMADEISNNNSEISNSVILVQNDVSEAVNSNEVVAMITESPNEIEAVAMVPESDDALQQAMIAASVAEEQE